MANGTFEPLGEWAPAGFPARPLTLYRPAGTAAKRPLLIAVDGHNALADRGEQRPGWYLHDAIDSLPAERAPFVIAVSNEGPTRADELTPWVTDGWGGSGDRFTQWIADVLVREARRGLPVIEGASGVALIGASWGGLFALYSHFVRPDIFGGAIAISPSFWVGRGKSFEFVSHHPIPSLSRLYMDCGSLEDGGQMLTNADEATRILRERGYGEDRLMWKRVMNADHTEREWRKRLPEALAFMYRP